MKKCWRIVLFLIITTGFVCGFAELVLPGQTDLLETPRPGNLQFQRLHIFLFNLVAGGTILLWFTEGKQVLSWHAVSFLGVALLFSLAAFLNQYAIAIVLAGCLAVLVERVRIRRFGFFPLDFFQGDVTVAHKFHHAAVLCLSLGLLISAAVMINNQYLHLFQNLDLLLDEFYLGFSFPLSLVTFAVMFGLTNEKTNRVSRWLGEASFWVVTVGVIVFFVFIISNSFYGQLVSAIILLIDVVVVFGLFKRNSRHLEQTEFLISGMSFLIATGVTGVAIILWRTPPFENEVGLKLLLQVHAYLSLYGWNLAGLTVVARHSEFPLRMHEVEIILLHWATIAVLAPLGTVYATFACLAIPAFAIVVALMLLSRGHAHVATRSHDQPMVASPLWRRPEVGRR